MTREQAKRYKAGKTVPITADGFATLQKWEEEIIDRIFNDFESRTCEGCKYQEVEQHDKEHFHKWCFIHCTSKINEEMESFYCSKWEAKYEKED